MRSLTVTLHIEPHLLDINLTKIPNSYNSERDFYASHKGYIMNMNLFLHISWTPAGSHMLLLLFSLKYKIKPNYESQFLWHKILLIWILY